METAPGRAVEPVNLLDYEVAARDVLSPMAFAFIAGGSEDEVSLDENRTAFGRWRLLPRMMQGVAAPSLATTVLGQPVDLPVLVSPMGLHRLAHPAGELATAAAARRAGTIYGLACTACLPLEEIARYAGQWWFQTYILTDRGRVIDLVRRAEAAGAGAIVVTVDVPVLGRREADVRHGFELPAGLTMPNLLPTLSDPTNAGYRALTAWDPALSWSDIDLMAAATSLPVVVKGVLRSDDAHRAIEHGARAVVVSNHGGRQLDGAVGSLDALPAIVDAIGDRAEVYLDGGVRRGTDVLKALALGARAVFVGRPVLFGLAVGGEEGVTRVFDLLRHELHTDMILCGLADVGAIDRSLVAPAGVVASSSPTTTSSNDTGSALLTSRLSL